jgi:hypothetical protein
MEKVFKFIRDSRKAFVELVDGLTVEQLNHIPAGFNNNIIWNFGHIVVSTQALCYVRTVIRPDASAIKYFGAYAKGTKPTYNVGAAEIEELKALAIQSIDQIEADYRAGVFDRIKPFETSTYYAEMDDIAEVLAMTSGHDNLHLGYALAQRRIIK